MVPSVAREKIPATPQGIDPATFRITTTLPQALSEGGTGDYLSLAGCEALSIDKLLLILPVCTV
jgi:hypothetical protein